MELKRVVLAAVACGCSMGCIPLATGSGYGSSYGQSRRPSYGNDAAKAAYEYGSAAERREARPMSTAWSAQSAGPRMVSLS